MLLVRSHVRAPRRASPTAQFNSDALPKTSPIPKQTVEQLRKFQEELRARDEKLSELLAKGAVMDEELQLRAEVAAAKKAHAATPDTHDYAESATRDLFIDVLLKEAGWALEQPRDREFEVTGMPNAQGNGFVDYVLWGDDGKPLGLVEAKRSRSSPELGQRQAKLYADCLEQRLASARSSSTATVTTICCGMTRSPVGRVRIATTSCARFAKLVKPSSATANAKRWS